MRRFLGAVALFLTLVSPFHVTILNYLKATAGFAQQQCILFVENSTAQHSGRSHSTTNEITALLCGKNLPDQKHQSIYALSGLIHLFVVSGSHFLFIEQIASFCKIPLFIRLLIHLCFLFCSGFQPPAARFFIHFILFTVTPGPTLDQTLRRDQRTFLSGLITLCLFPQWIHSFSLLLSWAASLAISCCQEFGGTIQRLILTQLAIFCMLFPLLCQIQTPHPLSILMNLILGPVLGIALLPLAILAVFSSTALFVMESLLGGLRLFLEMIFESVWSRSLLILPHVPMPQSILSFWILFLHLLTHLCFVIHRRNQTRLSFNQVSLK